MALCLHRGEGHTPRSGFRSFRVLRAGARVAQRSERASAVSVCRALRCLFFFLDKDGHHKDIHHVVFSLDFVPQRSVARTRDRQVQQDKCTHKTSSHGSAAAVATVSSVMDERGAAHRLFTLQYSYYQATVDDRRLCECTIGCETEAQNPSRSAWPLPLALLATELDSWRSTGISTFAKLKTIGTRPGHVVNECTTRLYHSMSPSGESILSPDKRHYQRRARQ